MRKLRKSSIIGITALTITGMIYSCQSADQLQQDMYYTNGRDLYISHCQNCHGSKGEGLEQLAPPLTDTIFLKENKKKIACFIKNGLEGKITVAGKVYDEKMPDEQDFADIDIAQVIVYITNNFGNKQGMYTPAQVNEDLKNCK